MVRIFRTITPAARWGQNTAYLQRKAALIGGVRHPVGNGVFVAFQTPGAHCPESSGGHELRFKIAGGMQPNMTTARCGALRDCDHHRKRPPAQTSSAARRTSGRRLPEKSSPLGARPRGQRDYTLFFAEADLALPEGNHTLAVQWNVARSTSSGKVMKVFWAPVAFRAKPSCLDSRLLPRQFNLLPTQRQHLT